MGLRPLHVLQRRGLCVLVQVRPMNFRVVLVLLLSAPARIPFAFGEFAHHGGSGQAAGREGLTGEQERGQSGAGFFGKGGVSGTSLDMQALLSAIQSVNLNVDTRFNTLQTQCQTQFQDLRSDLNKLQSEMVTRTQFETLETRVYALESNVVSGDNPDVKFLKAQLDKLDPAHKCMSLIGFKGADAATFAVDRCFSQGEVRVLRGMFAGGTRLERALAGPQTHRNQLNRVSF